MWALKNYLNKCIETDNNYRKIERDYSEIEKTILKWKEEMV